VTRRLLAILVVAALAFGGAAAFVTWRDGSLPPLIPAVEECQAQVDGHLVELDLEQSRYAALITAISVQRGMPARAATIALAAAYQESDLRNLEYGDRDSLGLFQQRPSQGWGTRKQILDPVYASGEFFDALAKVDGYETMPITEVAQKVQRSAFPDAYADHEPEGRAMASTLSGYSPGGFNCVLRGPSDVAEQEPGPSGMTPRAAAVVKAAARETGRSAVVPATTDGKSLRFTVPAAAGDRLAWSFAQWAVARADGLDVIAVEVPGRHWLRDDSTEGWTAGSTSLPPGSVIVRVA